MDDASPDIAAHATDLFAIESQTIQRLLWSAEAADVDGYPELAATYRSIAEEKSGHAQGLLEFVADPDQTALNLDELTTSVDRTSELRTNAEQARGQGRDDLADWFETLAAASERQLDRLRASRKLLR